MFGRIIYNIMCTCRRYAFYGLTSFLYSEKLQPSGTPHNPSRLHSNRTGDDITWSKRSREKLVRRKRNQFARTFRDVDVLFLCLRGTRHALTFAINIGTRVFYVSNNIIRTARSVASAADLYFNKELSSFAERLQIVWFELKFSFSDLQLISAIDKCNFYAENCVLTSNNCIVEQIMDATSRCYHYYCCFSIHFTINWTQHDNILFFNVIVLIR